MAAADEDPALTDELRDAAPYGVGAYVVGFAITFVIVSTGEMFRSSLDMAGILYGLFHLVVEFAGGGSLIDQDEPLLYTFVSLPALPIVVLARTYVAGTLEATNDGVGATAGETARRGALLAGGYAAAMALAALLFTAEAQPGELVYPHTAQLDPVTAALGGVLFAGGFGGLGGVLAGRDSNWPYYVVAGGLGLLVLLIVLAAAAAPA